MDTYLEFSISTTYTPLGWEARVTAPGAPEPHPVVLRATEYEGERTVVKRAKLLIAAIRLREKHQSHSLDSAA